MSQPAVTLDNDPVAGPLDGLRDARVGLALLHARGARLKRGDVFARLHLAAANEGFAQRAVACFTFADTAPERLPDDLVLERVAG